jgi:hypothetical protein
VGFCGTPYETTLTPSFEIECSQYRFAAEASARRRYVRDAFFDAALREHSSDVATMTAVEYD